MSEQLDDKETLLFTANVDQLVPVVQLKSFINELQKTEI